MLTEGKIMTNHALYIDIADRILHAIQSGEYPENAPLPSERFLCGKYHVSRSTIRQALLRLKDTDIVYTVQGNGTFIKPQVFTQPLTQFYSFTDTLKNSNVIIQNDIIDYKLILADASLAKQTGHPEGSAFHKFLRLRSAREYPLMLETTYLPQNRFVKLNLDILARGSLYEYLRTKYGFFADHATETFRPVLPTPEEKGLLQMPVNTPCILLERFSYEENLLIEYTKSIVRGDKYIFRIDLQNALE